MRTIRAGIAVLVFLVAGHAQAVVFHDGVSNVQRTLEFVKAQIEQVRQYAQMVEQVRQGAELVTGTITMVEQGAKQLANMPQGMNVLDMLTHTTNQASAILGRVQYIGFNLDQSTQQFEHLYKDLSLATTPEGRAEIVRRMRDARMEMTGLSIQVQSIRQTFAAIYARIAALLGASSITEGVKAMQQVQLQQQALLQQQQQLGLTMQAVSARLAAMKDAEEMMMQQLHSIAAQQEAAAWYGGQGPKLPPGFNGFRILPGGQ